MTKNTNYTSDAMNFIKQMNENIPNLARGLGKGMREFREATDGIKREIEKSAEPVTEEMKKASQDVQQQINDHRAANQ